MAMFVVPKQALADFGATDDLNGTLTNDWNGYAGGTGWTANNVSTAGVYEFTAAGCDAANCVVSDLNTDGSSLRTVTASDKGAFSMVFSLNVTNEGSSRIQIRAGATNRFYINPDAAGNLELVAAATEDIKTGFSAATNMTLTADYGGCTAASAAGKVVAKIDAGSFSSQIDMSGTGDIDTFRIETNNVGGTVLEGITIDSITDIPCTAAAATGSTYSPAHLWRTDEF